MMRALIKISIQDVNQVVFPFRLGVPERPGAIVSVLEMPSSAYSYGSFATEFKEASRPFCSAP